VWYNDPVRRPSADELRKLKDEAAEAAAKGRLGKAAELYREAAEGDPKDVATRQKLAEVLRRSGRVPEAIAAYREVAARFGSDGLLIKAIAISKTILELDPRHVETQWALAELYAQRARAAGARPPRRTVMQATKAPEPEPEAVPLETLVEPEPGAPALATPRPQASFEAPAPVRRQARRDQWDDAPTAFARIRSAAEDAIEAGVDEDVLVEADPIDVEIVGDEPLALEALEGCPQVLPRVPIFSDLSRPAFLALTEGMVLHRVAEGDAVLREGEEGTSFYVVASGRLAVSKRDDAGSSVVLAHLGEGDFFGEMALLSGARRAASVTAEHNPEVLELRADVLLAIARQHPHVAQSLRRFYRQRLLANALAASPIFRPFDRGERKVLVERFRARDVAAGEAVIREGEPSDGLYVVLEGAVDVVKRRDGRVIVVGHLREGELFGEMSCLRKAPASATVVVKRPGTLLRLPRKDFDELVVTHPQILEAVSTLSEEHAENLDAILSGHAQWTDEGLVLL
jgi:CRP-like cAMP-binding protein